MSVIGVTGARRLDDELQRRVVTQHIRFLPQDASVVTGGCIGVDVLAAQWARLYNHMVHVVVPYRRKYIDPHCEMWATSVEEMPADKPTLRDRDRRMVELIDEVWAFPGLPEHHPSSLHSGTWKMVHAAQHHKLAVRIFPLWAPQNIHALELLRNVDQTGKFLTPSGDTNEVDDAS